MNGRIKNGENTDNHSDLVSTIQGLNNSCLIMLVNLNIVACQLYNTCEITNDLRDRQTALK